MLSFLGICDYLAYPLLFSAFALLALAAAVTDILRREIGHGVTIALLVVALLRDLLGPGLAIAWMPSLVGTLGLLLPSLGLLWLFQRGEFGAGDVKFLFAALLYLPGERAGLCLLVTALAGGLLACVYLLRHRLMEKMPSIGVLASNGQPQAADLSLPAPTLPYGVAIAVGAVFAALPDLTWLGGG